MYPRLAVPLLLALLAGCASAPEVPPPAITGPAAYEPASPQLHALSGSLLGVPAGAEVELALLEVDERNRPEQLLSSLRLRGAGDELPFMLQFNPDTFSSERRVELRGRVTQAGQLIMKLPPRTIGRTDSRSLGALQLVPAP